MEDYRQVTEKAVMIMATLFHFATEIMGGRSDSQFMKIRVLRSIIRYERLKGKCYFVKPCWIPFSTLVGKK